MRGKENCYRIQAKNAPDYLWDSDVSWVRAADNITANSSQCANNRIPLEFIKCNTPDITKYLAFMFYDCVTFKYNARVNPLNSVHTQLDHA